MKKMKIDRLFLERNCSHCGTIRAILDMDAVAEDGFTGKDGQSFHVFVSQSNEASKELLQLFDVGGNPIPLLVTYEGTVLEKTGEIIKHLKENGMAEE